MDVITELVDWSIDIWNIAKEEWFGMVVCSEDRVSVGSAGTEEKARPERDVKQNGKAGKTRRRA